MEIFLALRGVEVSIINNVNLEIATISLKDSSTPVWSLESSSSSADDNDEDDNVSAGVGKIKTFTNEYSSWLERNYVKYLRERSYIRMSTINSVVLLNGVVVDENKQPTAVTNAAAGGGEEEAAGAVQTTTAAGANSEQHIRVEIDFKNMELLKPERGKLRRDWAPGLDVQYRTSANMTSLKCRIYNFQVRCSYIFRS